MVTVETKQITPLVSIDVFDLIIRFNDPSRIHSATTAAISFKSAHAKTLPVQQ